MRGGFFAAKKRGAFKETGEGGSLNQPMAVGSQVSGAACQSQAILIK